MLKINKHLNYIELFLHRYKGKVKQRITIKHKEETLYDMNAMTYNVYVWRL